MSAEYELARQHFASLLAEAREQRANPDVIGRALLNEITRSWLETRTWTDVAEELRFVADSLDPETDFEFMRP